MNMITALEAARRSPSFREDRGPRKIGEPAWTSFFSARVRDIDDKIKEEIPASPNVRTTGADWRSGLDWQANLMMGGPAAAGYQGTATAATATSLTATGTPWTADVWRGHIVAVGANTSGTGSIVWGVITANTTSVLTVDRWYNANSPSGAAGTTPNATSQFQILPGQAPAWYIGLGAGTATPAVSDVDLTTSGGTEITGSGLDRVMATTLSHTSGATSYLLSKVFTASGSATVKRAAVFNAAYHASTGGAMPFESNFSADAVMISGDVLTVNVTVSI